MREVVAHWINGRLLEGVNVPFRMVDEIDLFADTLMTTGHSQGATFPLNDSTNAVFGFPFERSRDKAIALSYAWMAQYAGKFYKGSFVATDVTEREIKGNLVLGDYQVLKDLSTKNLTELNLGRIDIPPSETGVAYGLWHLVPPFDDTTAIYVQVKFVDPGDVVMASWGFGVRMGATSDEVLILGRIIDRINAPKKIKWFYEEAVSGEEYRPGTVIEWRVVNAQGNFTGEKTWHCIDDGGYTLSSPDVPFEYLTEWEAEAYLNYYIGQYLKDGDDLYKVISKPPLVVPLGGSPEYPDISNSAVYQPRDKTKYWQMIANDDVDLAGFFEDHDERFFWEWNDHPGDNKKLQAFFVNDHGYKLKLVDTSTGVPYRVSIDISVPGGTGETQWANDEETFTTADAVEAYYRPIVEYMEKTNHTTTNPEMPVLFPMIYNPGYTEAEDEDYAVGTVYGGFINYYDDTEGGFGSFYRHVTPDKKYFFCPMVYTDVVVKALCDLMGLTPVGQVWDDLQTYPRMFEVSLRSHDYDTRDTMFLGRMWNWKNYIEISQCLPEITVSEYLKGLEMFLNGLFVVDFTRKELQMDYAGEKIFASGAARLDLTARAIRCESRRLPEAGGFDLFFTPDRADDVYFDYELHRLRTGEGKKKRQIPFAPIWNYGDPVADPYATGGARTVGVAYMNQPGISVGDRLDGSFSRRVMFGGSEGGTPAMYIDSGYSGFFLESMFGYKPLSKTYLEFLDLTSPEDWLIDVDGLDLFNLKKGGLVIIRSMLYVVGKTDFPLPLDLQGKVTVWAVRSV